jgi:hypothetical protein
LLDAHPEFHSEFCTPLLLQRALPSYYFLDDDDKYAVAYLVSLFLTSPLSIVRATCINLINLERFARMFQSSDDLKELFCESMASAIRANPDYVFEFHESGIFDDISALKNETEPFAVRRAAVVALFGCFRYCDYTVKARLLFLKMIPAMSDFFETLTGEDLIDVLEGIAAVHEHIARTDREHQELYMAQIEQTGVYTYLENCDEEGDRFRELAQTILAIGEGNVDEEEQCVDEPVDVFRGDW